MVSSCFPCSCQTSLPLASPNSQFVILSLQIMYTNYPSSLPSSHSLFTVLAPVSHSLKTIPVLILGNYKIYLSRRFLLQLISVSWNTSSLRIFAVCPFLASATPTVMYYILSLDNCNPYIHLIHISSNCYSRSFWLILFGPQFQKTFGPNGTCNLWVSVLSTVS